MVSGINVKKMRMNNNEKANLYDQYVRQASILEREISALKSQYVINIPENVQKKIDDNNQKINELQRKLNNLYK